jgi:hypothetical protein
LSTPEKESIALKYRSIEVALDNFRSRVESSLNSQVSLLKERVDNTNARLLAVTSKVGSAQANADLAAVIQETKSILQKDLLHDTVVLLNEKLTELENLISRLKSLSADQIEVEEPSIVQQRVMHKSFPSSLRRETSEPDDEKDKEIASLREEINRLYNLTEREPRFQPFWILRDAYPNSVQITKIARMLNAAPGEVLENLRIFEQLGLAEIKEGEARATRLVRPNKPRAEIS